MNRSGLTAIARRGPSAPLRWAWECGWIEPPVLDWGCGRGGDVRWLQGRDVEAWGYDPNYRPEPVPSAQGCAHIRTVLAIYVLHILTPDERQKLLRQVANVTPAAARVVVAVREAEHVRGEAELRRWVACADGWRSRRGIFQCGYTVEELADAVRPLGVILAAGRVSGGVVCVLRRGDTMTGDDLRKQRQQLGWTLHGLAHRLAVCTGTVWRWEAGQRRITPAMAQLIRRVTEDGRRQPNGAG